MGIIANFARARVSHGDLGSKRQGVFFFEEEEEEGEGDFVWREEEGKNSVNWQH